MMNDPQNQENEWRARQKVCHLHRFPAGHYRLWGIARRISDRYQGDARRIWEGKAPRVVLQARWTLGRARTSRA
jgi:hypothetical protein